MKTLECTIFNVEHGFCAFIKSPNNYGLMIDCGGRDSFSPIKWIKQNYNYGKNNIQYWKGRRIAELIVTHLHADHFSDVGSFVEDVDKPKIILRDKQTLKFIDEKIKEEKDANRKKLMETFKKFQGDYDQDVGEYPDWGFDFFEYDQITYETAEGINANRDKIINNRSYIISIGFAGNKLLFPGDIETEGWEKALLRIKTQNILSGTDFFVASHHGRKSGWNCDVLEHSGLPYLYLISARARDDGTYYNGYNSKNAIGFQLEGESEKSYAVSTKIGDSFSIEINEYGITTINAIYTKDNLNKNQQDLRDKRSRQTIRELIY